MFETTTATFYDISEGFCFISIISIKEKFDAGQNGGCVMESGSKNSCLPRQSLRIRFTESGIGPSNQNPTKKQICIQPPKNPDPDPTCKHALNFSLQILTDFLAHGLYHIYGFYIFIIEGFLIRIRPKQPDPQLCSLQRRNNKINRIKCSWV